VAILLGIVSLVPVLLYPLAKRVTNWPQAMLGLTFSWAAPEGMAAVTGRLDAVALLLWAAAFFWILGYDTIYAHQDREDDALIGIGSTALRWGERTRPFLAACYAGMLTLLALAGWQAGVSTWFYPALLLPAALLARQVLTLDIHDPALCLRLFKANREVGLAVALAFLAGRL
ncbi:MAG: UbiA family prenyltransferase, partial [Acetobacteraceae bacterium]|nr:UbiA family prenyltransferase [Acetobacteraceae bacterium]